MNLLIKPKKLKIKELKTRKERFKSLKFELHTLDYVVYFPKKKFLSTDFFCQRVDVCFTDENQKILYIHSNLKSEKRIFHFKSKNIWILPVGTTEKLKVGDTLTIEKKEKKK